MKREFIPDILFIACCSSAIYLFWTKPTLTFSQLDKLSYSEIESLPIGLILIASMVMPSYVCFMNVKAEKQELSGLNRFLSKKTSLVIALLLSSIACLSSVSVMSYEIKLTDSIITAQRLKYDYRYRLANRIELNRPINSEEVGEKSLERLNGMIHARTGKALDLNDWDASNITINDYLESLGK
ncbi:hypothetical protein PPW95_25325 (plasmid) [Vibrio parahaemolyticus]|uniref:hypothetical protein n=1 Tax=Vibrio harveyi group TaxID=717610 RepID=UPI0009717BFA|nr:MULTISPECIES: hypothetical protein [Vibrio harveyi group]APX10059.1 hypothetical protein BWP24_28125 [Vibrio campbellii]WCP78933.1 hypothetical protein PPW95_25325 [Vibrio parahaemolyticus]